MGEPATYVGTINVSDLQSWRHKQNDLCCTASLLNSSGVS